MQSLAEFLGVQDGILESDRPITEAPHEDLTDEQLCRKILQSQEYRQSVFNRVLSGTLPPAVEAMIWDRAYGKPVKRIEVKDTTNALEALTVEQLEERALFLAGLARRMRQESNEEQMKGSSETLH